MPAQQAHSAAFTAMPSLAAALLLLAAGSPGLGQQVTPTSNGFTIGSSSGQSSFYRQESRSQANTLLQHLSTNVSTVPGSETDPRYTITNPLEPFNVNNERQSQSAGSSTTSIGGGGFSGFNFSVFAQ